MLCIGLSFWQDLTAMLCTDVYKAYVYALSLYCMFVGPIRLFRIMLAVVMG